MRDDYKRIKNKGWLEGNKSWIKEKNKAGWNKSGKAYGLDEGWLQQGNKVWMIDRWLEVNKGWMRDDWKRIRFDEGGLEKNKGWI